MGRSPRNLLFRSIAGAFTALLLLSSTADASWKMQRQGHRLKDESGSRVYTTELQKDGGKVSFKIHLRLEQGEILFALEDSSGRRRWEKRYEGAAEVEIKEWFNGRDGLWRLTCDYENAVGKYSVRLSSG